MFHKYFINISCFKLNLFLYIFRLNEDLAEKWSKSECKYEVTEISSSRYFDMKQLIIPISRPFYTLFIIYRGNLYVFVCILSKQMGNKLSLNCK